MLVPMSERGYDEQGCYSEPGELELPECGYWLDSDVTGRFVMRSADRVCLGMFLDGQLTEVSGPVEAP